jgi:hypothetical protein
MNPTQFQETIPDALKNDLQGWSGRAFERRIIIVRDDASKAWVLLGCTLRPLQVDASPPNLRFEYQNALLVADCIHGSELKLFFTDPVRKLSELGEKDLGSQFWPGCQRDTVALNNYWMDRPGVVYTWRPKEQPNPPHVPMLLPSAPYYPDVHEATRDWLQLREHSGHGDKGLLVLLLPETRAFIQEHCWSDDDEHLRLQVAGSAAVTEQVLVKGAYWAGTNVRQVQEGLAADSSVTLTIPSDADRLEFFLLGKDGTVYEHHKETLGFAGEKRFLGARHRMSADRVVQALSKGEGPQIEFKPFIALPKFKSPLKPDTRHKLEEVLETIAAFSNAEGGTIFMGIANDFRVTGISDGLRQWAESDATRDAVELYVGALRAYLRDEMQLPVDIGVSWVEHQNDFLVLVEVPRSRTPVSVKGKGILWRRVGAGNMRVAPEEWAAGPKDVWPFRPS